MRRWRRLRRWRRRKIELGGDVAVAMRVVGTCGSCGGPLLFAPARQRASCPCGDTQLTPRLFTAAAQTPAG